MGVATVHAPGRSDRMVRTPNAPLCCAVFSAYHTSDWRFVLKLNAKGISDADRGGVIYMHSTPYTCPSHASDESTRKW